MTPTQQLERDLRSLIETDRAALVDSIARCNHKIVDGFLSQRNDRLFLQDYYGPVRYRTAPLDVICEGTDYDAAVARFHRDHLRSTYRPGKPETYPAWVVIKRADADQRLTRLAEVEAELYIQTFLSRALAKLGPVAESAPGYRVERIAALSGFSGGTWTGWLEFSWPDGRRFACQLKIITNWRDNRPYAQYPATIHQAVLTVGAKPAGASIDDVWKAFSAEAPAAQPRRPRWTKLVKGSVVEVDGRFHLIKTPGQLKKQGLPVDAPQVARIDGHGHVDFADGTTRNIEWTSEQKQAFLHETRFDFDAARWKRTQWAFDTVFAPATVAEEA